MLAEGLLIVKLNFGILKKITNVIKYRYEKFKHMYITLYVINIVTAAQYCYNSIMICIYFKWFISEHTQRYTGAN